MTSSSNDFTRRRAVVIGASGALSAVPLWAASAGAAAPSSPTTIELARVVERLVGRPVDAIQPSPVAGLFEVVVGTQVLYIDAAGRHVFDGHLVDVDTRASPTARRQAELERTNLPAFEWNRLDFNDAIKTIHGREVAGRALVVYTIPVSFLGAASREANESIWCAADRAAAWELAMKGQPIPKPARSCDLAALERNADLAKRYRIAGTPTIFTPKGQRLEGAVSAEVLERALSQPN